LQCKSPSFYLEGSCVQAVSGKCETPNSIQSFFVINEEKICETCSSPCLECMFNESDPEVPICTKCMPGFFADDGKCVKDCSEGNYAEANLVCRGMNLLFIYNIYFFFFNKKKE
jgi:hypothetical protein